MSEHGSREYTCLAYSKYLDVTISGLKWRNTQIGQEERINNAFGFSALSVKEIEI